MRLIPVEDVSPSDVLLAIEQAFGQSRGSAWFEWKHREGPWGPSTGLAALDDDGIVGVRLLLPWRVRLGDQEINAFRAVEAASVPRAQGRGVFKMLNKELMERAASEDAWTFLFSTPNKLSRGGYAKLGWIPLQTVVHGYHLPLRRRSGTIEIVSPQQMLADIPMTSPEAAGNAIQTAWTPSALRWRTDPRTGNSYSASFLREGSAPNGLIYRILPRRRIRVLSIISAWGSRGELRALVAGTARMERAVLVLAPVGPGAAETSIGPAVRRGGSLLMVWSTPDDRGEHRWPITEPGAWSLTMADLESVL